MSGLKVYRVRETRAPHRTWDCLAKDMAHAKAQVLANEPRLKAGDLGVSVPGGRPTFPEDDE